jgi:manganese/zinc/iron transport system substrate-binding protein
MHTNRWLTPVLITLVLAVASCARAAEDDDGRLRVVATTGMIGDAASRIGGANVRVQTLMGPGIDPHLYRATAGDVRRLAGAQLILFNGLHLEAAMGDVLREMGARVSSVPVAESIDPARLLTPPEFEGAYDPHVWFDVGLWRTAVEAIREALIAADTANAPAYRANAAAYLAELDELDAWTRERLRQIPPDRRLLVTAHDAFNYFGRAYGVEVRGLQGINTASEAGTADVQQLAQLIVERRVPAIFVETSVPRRTIEAVQAAVRARGHDVEIGRPLFSDALGDAGTPEGTYVGMFRHNVETIVQALSRNGVAAS